MSSSSTGRAGSDPCGNKENPKVGVSFQMIRSLLHVPGLRPRCCPGICSLDVVNNVGLDQVLGQNRLVSRLCHCLHLCWTRGVYWVVEQPRSSVLFEHPRFKKILQLQDVEMVTTELGAHGGPSKKDTILAGTAPYMKDC